MEGRHRLELGSHLTPVEWVAGRTGWPSFLSFDSSTDSLASVVRPHHRPIREHVAPLRKQGEFA